MVFNIPFTFILEPVRPLRYAEPTAPVILPFTKVGLCNLSITQFVLTYETCITLRVQGTSLRMGHSRVARLGARRAQVRAGATDRADTSTVDVTRTTLFFDFETLILGREKILCQTDKNILITTVDESFYECVSKIQSI